MARQRLKVSTGAVAAPTLRAPDGKLTSPMLAALNAWMLAVSRKLAGFLSFGTGADSTQSGNLDGQWRHVTTPATPDTEFSVPHGLGRVPVDFFQAGGDKAARLYDSRRGSWDRNTIFLKCDVASASVRFLLF